MGSERKRSVVAINAEDRIGEVASESDSILSIASAKNAESAVKFRRLLPLLPKPEVHVSASSGRNSSDRRSKRLPGPCGLRACEKLSCNLDSHRRYAGTLEALQKHSTSSTDGSNGQLAIISRSSSSTPQIQKTIARSAGFPVLPLNESEALNPTIQHLFHDFFVHQLSGLLKLIVTPFEGYEVWAKKRHDYLFELGVQTQLDCLNFIGAAYLHALGHARTPQPGNHETGIVVHSSMLKGLRATLETFDPVRDTDRVLNIMYTLVIFDLMTNSDVSASSLLNHKRAMMRVIESCGGLHKCGPNLPLAVSLDRLIAVVTHQEPVFTTWDNVKLPIQRAPKHPSVYGSFFRDDAEEDSIHEDVIAYCAETCRAIEILEGEDWRFSAEPKEPTGEVYYLYYLRDRVTYQSIFLNARMAREDNPTPDNIRSRCVLLAAKLVEYAALWDNYVAVLPFTIADRLMRLLTEQNPLVIWEDCEDSLKWILFVLACVSKNWKGRNKALDLCRRTLHILYDGDWPKNWKDEQRSLVARFVWSWSRLDSVFTIVCEQLRP